MKCIPQTEPVSAIRAANGPWYQSVSKVSIPRPQTSWRPVAQCVGDEGGRGQRDEGLQIGDRWRGRSAPCPRGPSGDQGGRDSSRPRPTSEGAAMRRAGTRIPNAARIWSSTVRSATPRTASASRSPAGPTRQEAVAEADRAASPIGTATAARPTTPRRYVPEAHFRDAAVAATPRFSLDAAADVAGLADSSLEPSTFAAHSDFEAIREPEDETSSLSSTLAPPVAPGPESPRSAALLRALVGAGDQVVVVRPR